ncbi:tetratricopeptide repeat-containing sulfotransferase family protein [Pseudoxanthomonas indica]|uniref:Tetratricopeptide repeat-containing protein n=1 Tax=Pseudoxanthomonas indica TaxID=428993 RepID=A0A1T5J0X5_9GAMM|nr:sulfotransferase [Pseudoxanthomonas indica]GGD55516.1 sulfotransferase [Pseudoxanthomonas indica]SKC44991.1 Tetratricopeptide repeat-containing protein [Pseudoxanthomonas indica]
MSQDPARIYRASVDALNRRDWAGALRLAQPLSAAFPQHAGVHFVAGVAALQLRRMDAAHAHLAQATRLNPERADYAAQFARLLATIHRQREAVAEADRALALSNGQPDDPMVLDILGVIYTQAHEAERAAQAFQRGVASLPNEPRLRFNLAATLTFVGDVEGAEREYEACLRLQPRYWKAYLSLSQLRRQTPADNHVARWQNALAQIGNDVEGALCVNMALEKEFDDLGDPRQAFAHLSQGKAAWRTRLNYDSARDAAMFQAVIDQFPEPPPDTDGSDSAEPIFVFGLPRTGTTLVDRILSSHGSVHSAGELNHFAVAVQAQAGLRARSLHEVLLQLRGRSIDWRALGQAYLASTRPGTGHTPHFVDKLPHNFLYAGFIARVFPNARMICLRRDPMDSCFNNFRQLFNLESPNYDYSFDLLDCGRYYLQFDRLMAHWRRALPGRILEVAYEDIVEAQEATTRQLLAFCGLPWDDACLAFERNTAPVATASAVQVRSPIYRSSLHRWKRYEEHLQALKDLLQAGGIELWNSP